MTTASRSALERVLQYAGSVLVKQHTAPFWWHSEDGFMRNGTMSFVHTGERLLGVTALHVYQGYRQAKATHPDLVTQVGAVGFDPEAHEIAIDEKLDLATFALPAGLVADAGSVPHSPPSWPPPEVQERDLLIVGGWPGSQRTRREALVDFDFHWFYTVLDATPTDWLSVTLKLDAARSLAPGVSRDDLKNLDTAGFSGGPVFRLEEETPPLTLTLVGIVTEGGHFEVLRARPTRLIRSDGQIDGPQRE